MQKIFTLQDGKIIASIIESTGGVFDSSLEVTCYIKTAKNGNISATIAWTRVLENPFCVSNPKAIETYRGGAEKLRYEYIKRGGSPEKAKEFLKKVKSDAVLEYKLYLLAIEKENREKDVKERAEAFKKELKELLKKYEFDLNMETELTYGFSEVNGCVADLILEDNKYDTGDETVVIASIEDGESISFE